MTEDKNNLNIINPIYQEIEYENPLVILENPKTETYKEIKEYINTNNIPWYFGKTIETEHNVLVESDENYTNIPFFSHSIILRPTPESPHSTIVSYDTQKYIKCISEILEHNNITVNCIYRANINMTFYTSGSNYTLPHVDHNFPHNNLLIYFNEFSGGEIKVYKNKEWHIYKPEEDDVVLFSGLHCHRPVQSPGEFRKVLVTTFI